ncbi:probable cytochrome P450 305a1 [Solenopsis invicta]|uniref:probable cytochrome P450 305a1 n=1 Tax=Solenopsis invicta TaxID=13686 RepID=UPI00193EACE2|nr:probable cytochrome P450 305a1 [Solenopsis invicta]
MVVTAALMILTILFITVVLTRERPKGCPPGPFPWPFIGNQYYLRRLQKKYGGQHMAFLHLSKIYNSNVISLRLGGKYTIAVSDSKLIQQICVNEKYDGRPWNEFMKLRNLGMKKGLTANDGPEWKELHNWSARALRQVGFAKPAMVDLLNNEMTLIAKRLRDGGVQPIRPAFAPAVMNVLWFLVTRSNPSENPKRLQNFINMMDHRSQQFDATGGILSAIPWIRYIAPEMSGYNTVVTLNKELKTFLMDTINEHKKRYIKGNESDFIDLFLQEMYESEGQGERAHVFDDGNLIVTLIDFFIAGISTTTATLDILFMQITNHPDVQRKLHEEIDAVIGNRTPSLEDRKKMPYTEAILNESQRLTSVVVLLAPHRTVEDTILDGYKIPKDTIVLLNVHCNNMDPDVYPDPNSFRPERFINKDGNYQTQENLIQFGKGKRRCIGEVLARSAIFLLFVGVMQKYRLLPLPGKGSVNAEFTIGIIKELKHYELLIVPR